MTYKELAIICRNIYTDIEMLSVLGEDGEISDKLKKDIDKGLEKLKEFLATE